MKLFYMEKSDYSSYTYIFFLFYDRNIKKDYFSVINENNSNIHIYKFI